MGDCRHEKIDTFSAGYDGEIGYFCKHEDCGKELFEKDIVILIKAHKQLMDDVIEVAKEIPVLVKAYMSLVQLGIDEGFLHTDEAGKEKMRIAIYKSLATQAIDALGDTVEGGL